MLQKEKKNDQVKDQDYSLINGTFMPGDASRILLGIINDKITFHNLEILSIRERFNGDVSHSMRRIEELNEVREELRKVLAIAVDNEMEVRVNCTLKLELIK
jgi:hypothetical protein